MNLELKKGKNNRTLKPKKKDFPWDCAFGWTAFNIARMKYYQLTGKK
jgi:hypothetical protein